MDSWFAMFYLMWMVPVVFFVSAGAACVAFFDSRPTTVTKVTSLVALVHALFNIGFCLYLTRHSIGSTLDGVGFLYTSLALGAPLLSACALFICWGKQAPR